MKTNCILVLIVIFIFCTTTVFARGYSRGYHHGYGHGYYEKYRYHGYRGHHYGHHHDNDNDLGIALALVGGILLVSVLMSSANTSPRKVAYGTPYGSNQADVTAARQGMCYENRKVSGELQVDGATGQTRWVQFPYPLPRRVQVPCY